MTSIYFAAVQGVARKGAEGELIISGHTGQVVKTDRDYRAYAGLAPDLFAGDAVALNVFRKALWKEKRFEPQAFQSRQNFFAKANVTAIVSVFGSCKWTLQIGKPEDRTEYYWRFTDAAVRVAINRTTFRFRKKLRVVRLT